MQSGSMFNPWALNEKHRESAFKLANNLGCENDNPKEVVRYLLNIPAIDIVKSITIDVCIKKHRLETFLNNEKHLEKVKLILKN